MSGNREQNFKIPYVNADIASCRLFNKTNDAADSAARSGDQTCIRKACVDMRISNHVNGGPHGRFVNCIWRAAGGVDLDTIVCLQKLHDFIIL